MDPMMGAAIYVIIWWISLFMVLPIGVRSLHEGGVRDTAGHDAGAPVKPELGKKLIWTTMLAAVLWVVAFLALDMAYFSRFRAG
jgi:predicted secreted protein